MLVNPVAVVATAAIGIFACRAAGVNAHLHELALAAGICLLAGEVGVLPVLLHRSAEPGTLFQSAWLGTILHLAISVMAGGAVLVWMHPGDGFIFWLLGMYWSTLIGLCGLFVRFIRMPNLVR